VTAQKSAATLRRLRDLPAFAGLAATDLARIAEFVCEQSLRRGDVVFHEGDPGIAVYMVHTGMVEARTAGRILSRMGPGEWFGEMSFLTAAPRSATVEVVLDCHLLILDREAFSQLFAAQPRLYEQLAAVLSERLARASHAGPPGRSEIVVVDNRARWPGRHALVEALAAALEGELGQDVAVVSIAPRTRPAMAPRPARSDAVVAVSRRDVAEIRRRLTAQLTDLAHVPVVLLEIDDDLASEITLADFADVVLMLADATTPPATPSGRQRHIALYDRRRGPTPALCNASCAVLPLDERWRTWTVGHLARQVTRRTVGIALGSGVAYGLAHIGVLAALEEAGIPIDFIAGSSIGSIVGAGYALGASATELRATVERLARLRSPRALIETFLLLARDANLVRPGILGGDRLVEFLETIAPIPHARFSDLVIPYRAVATDLATGERVELADGTLADAMRASASAPWLLSPWRVDDRVLIDGGMCDPVPSTTVRGMGADLVIAVNVVPPLDPRARNPLTTILGAIDWLNPLSYFEGRRLPNSFDVVMKSLLILQHELGNSRVGEADILINPALGEFWFLEFWNAPALIERGAAAALAVVPAIRRRRSEGSPRDLAVARAEMA